MHEIYWFQTVQIDNYGLNKSPCMNESPPQGWEFKGITGAKFTNIYPLSCLRFRKVLYLQKARDRKTSHN